MLQSIKCYKVLNVTSYEMLQITKDLSGSKLETFCPCSASRNFSAEKDTDSQIRYKINMIYTLGIANKGSKIQ